MIGIILGLFIIIVGKFYQSQSQDIKNSRSLLFISIASLLTLIFIVKGLFWIFLILIGITVNSALLVNGIIYYAN